MLASVTSVRSHANSASHAVRKWSRSRLRRRCRGSGATNLKYGGFAIWLVTLKRASSFSVLSLCVQEEYHPIHDQQDNGTNHLCIYEGSLHEWLPISPWAIDYTLPKSNIEDGFPLPTGSVVYSGSMFVSSPPGCID